MKMNAYSIFDSASGIYQRPFFMPADGQATRAFKDISCDADHEIGKHPEDYSLWRVGIFDDNKGQLIPEDRECLATALELVAQARQIQRGQLDAFAKKNGVDVSANPGGSV